MLKNLVYKTIAYYRRNGLRRTVQRIFAELRKKLTSRQMEFYPSFGTGSATRLKKVSFLIGLWSGESKRYRVYNISDVVEKLLSWKNSGFSVHHQVKIQNGARLGRERLAQYIMRSPFSQEKMIY